MVTFIHAADLHLGTPFKGVGEASPWLRKRLIESSFKALWRLVDLAKESDMLLLAGDLLETGLPHLRARLELMKALNALTAAGVRVFMVAGNHDPYTSWEGVPLPRGVHFFTPEGGKVEVSLGGYKVSVSGISHGAKNVKDNLVHRIPSGKGDLRVALIHAYLQGLEGHDPYAPCVLDDLISRGFHYWAMGHIHREQVRCEDPWVVYPGNLQGRHFREDGPKGCCRVVWNDGRAQVEFCPLAPVVWVSRVLSLEGVEEETTLIERLESLKEEVRSREGVMLRIVLEGASPLYTLESEEWSQIEETLNGVEEREDFVWTTLEERLLPPLNLEELSLHDDFLAQLIKEARAVTDNPSLDEDLESLWGRGDVKRWIGSLEREDKARLADEALRAALVLMLGSK